VCDDGVDNDCDGLIDGEDQETCGGQEVNGGCACGTESRGAGLLLALAALMLLLGARTPARATPASGRPTPRRRPGP
jgi:hypothetical protein